MTADTSSFFRPPESEGPRVGRRLWVAVLYAALMALGAVAFASLEPGLQALVTELLLGAAVVVAAIGLVRLVMASIVTSRRDGLRAIERLLAQDPRPVAVTDGEGRPLIANERFRKLVNWTPGPVHRTLEHAFDRDPEALTAFRVMVSRLERGQAATEEITIRSATGIAAWRLETWPLRAGDERRVWTLTTLSALRRVVVQLEQERRRLLEFLDISSSGLFSVDEQGRFVFVNRTMADLLEVEAETLVSGNARLHDFLADPAPGLSPWEALEHGTLSQQGTLRIRAQSGREIRVVLEHEILRQETGGLRTRSVCRPLAADRDLFGEAAEREPLFQWMFQDAPVGIAMADAGLHLTEANGVFCRLVRQPLTALRDQPLASLIRGAERRAELTQALSQALVDGREAGPFEILPVADGAHSLQIYARRLTDDDGDIRGLILHAIDISQQKQLEAQVAHSQKMDAVGKLAAGIAHDFNNLLTTMLGNADLLLQRHRPGDPSFAEIMQIRQTSNRAATMVRQLLAFSRQQTLRPEVLDITTAIAEFSNILRRLIGEGIDLRIHHGRDLWPIKADPNQLDQVVMNLVVNARDAMNNRGQLTIETANVSVNVPRLLGSDTMPAGDYVRMTVTDTGCGIPPEIMERIFEPFFTTKDTGKGTGLGLSTVYGIIRQTGGFVEVTSTVGQGTAFSLYLPRHQAAEGEDDGLPIVLEPVGPAPVADLTGRETILLVEDEDGVRALAQRALTEKGYTVIAADCAEDALEQLDGLGRAPDLVISDVIMPEMDGPTMVRQIRQTHPGVKVIFISGYAEEAVRGELGDTDSINFLPKPFTLKVLAETVKSVLHR